MNWNAIGAISGALFEVIIQEMLRKAGYERVEPDGVRIRRDGRGLRHQGRGGIYQIDCMGTYFFVPLTCPLRMFVETKFVKRPVGRDAILKFSSVLRDISENYFVSLTDRPSSHAPRFNEIGAVFSATRFTRGAENYAYVSGISLFSYENDFLLRPSIELISKLARIIDFETVTGSMGEFKEAFAGVLETDPHRDMDFSSVESYCVKSKAKEAETILKGILKALNIEISSFGMFLGLVPVHIMSQTPIPQSLVSESDIVWGMIEFVPRTDAKRGIITISSPDVRPVELHFSFSFNIFNQFHSMYRKELREVADAYIDIPLVIDGLRRLIRVVLRDRRYYE